MKKQWRVGWKPIDKASAKPNWSGVIFDSFLEADHVAKALNASDLEHHYFPDLIPEQKPENCTDCGCVFETEELKPPPDPQEKGRLCPGCYANAEAALKANGSLHKWSDFMAQAVQDSLTDPDHPAFTECGRDKRA